MVDMPDSNLTEVPQPVAEATCGIACKCITLFLEWKHLSCAPHNGIVTSKNITSTFVKVHIPVGGIIVT